MRYVVISGKKYTEKDEILCIFDNTNQLNSLKKRCEICRGTLLWMPYKNGACHQIRCKYLY